MTIARFTLFAIVMLCLPATSLCAQDASGRVPPVFVPGQNSKVDSQKKDLASLIRMPFLNDRSKGNSSGSSSGKAPDRVAASIPRITAVNPSANKSIELQPYRYSPSTNLLGQACQCGYDCACSSGGCDGCVSGSGCGCDSGCDNCQNIGTSFFGRSGDRGPFSLNFERAGSGTSSCKCGYDDRCGGIGSRLARRLPISVRLRTNHCYQYVSPFVGYFDLQDYRGNIATGDREIGFNEGWQMGVKFGRVFENCLRLESEFSFRHATADTYSTGNFVGDMFVPTATFDSIDSVYALSSITNVLRDLKRLCYKGVTPYAGIGLGGMYVNGEVVTPALSRVDVLDDYAFAYQLILGASRRINGCTEGFLEYKYTGTSGIEIEDGAGNVIDDFPFQSSNVLFGIRIRIPNSRGCFCK